MIDTLGLNTFEICTNKDIEKLESLNFIMKDKNRYKDTKNYLAIRPNKNRTSTMIECLEKIDNIKVKTNHNGFISRLDIAFDNKSKIEENYKLYLLLLGCISYTRTKSLEKFFITEIMDFKKNRIEKGNLKLKTSKKELTIYNCEDKEGRLANTRIENRILLIENKFTNEEKIIKEIDKYNFELQNIIDNIDKFLLIVEDYFINFIVSLWEEEQQTCLNIQEFIKTIEQKKIIITKRILKEFLYKINYKKNVENFIRRYRQTRGNKSLEFICKKDLILLCKDIIRDNKQTIRLKIIN